MMMKTDYRQIVSKCLNEMIQTDYLTTILCFVPVQQEKQFLDNYLSYSAYVMEDSALYYWFFIIFNSGILYFPFYCFFKKQ